jgi:hypothetical protein
MSASLQILRDDLIKLWSEIEMSQISMAVGILFCLLILKMNLRGIDRRDFISEIMYVGYVVLVFLTLLVVVPDLLRAQSTLETHLLMTVTAVFVGFIRWNTKTKIKLSNSNDTGKAGVKNV